MANEDFRLGVLPLSCLEFSIVAQTVLRFAKIPNSLKSKIKLTYPIFFKGKQYCPDFSKLFIFTQLK